jgi:hypothetical protein
VEDPEGGVDADPEGVRARRDRARAGFMGGVESFKGEAGDGDGLGGTFEDLRKARWCQKTSCLPKFRLVWLTSQSPATPMMSRGFQRLQGYVFQDSGCTDVMPDSGPRLHRWGRAR